MWPMQRGKERGRGEVAFAEAFGENAADRAGRLFAQRRRPLPLLRSSHGLDDTAVAHLVWVDISA
eukprot:scaffold47043_cov27-Prasinocladus_malaysianus.AAC.1